MHAQNRMEGRRKQKTTASRTKNNSEIVQTFLLCPFMAFLFSFCLSGYHYFCHADEMKNCFNSRHFFCCSIVWRTKFPSISQSHAVTDVLFGRSLSWSPRRQCIVQHSGIQGWLHHAAGQWPFSNGSLFGYNNSISSPSEISVHSQCQYMCCVYLGYFCIFGMKEEEKLLSIEHRKKTTIYYPIVLPTHCASAAVHCFTQPLMESICPFIIGISLIFYPIYFVCSAANLKIV